MKWKKANLKEFRWLMENLSSLHADELHQMAIMNGVTIGFYQDAMAVWLETHGGWTMLDDARRVLCMASKCPHPSMDGTYAGWFMASHVFFKNTGRNLRAVRKRFEEEQELHPGAYTTISFTMHPKMDKWAKVMGFDVSRGEGTGRRFLRLPRGRMDAQVPT